jgi:predicted alpha/beta hydrolase family esterase
MKIFTVPGLFNSGPQHWQTQWENEYGFVRIEQQDWETPVCDDWLQTIDAVVNQQPLNKVVLIGHSLACCTIVRWSGKIQTHYKRGTIGCSKRRGGTILSTWHYGLFSHAKIQTPLSLYHHRKFK